MTDDLSVIKCTLSELEKNTKYKIKIAQAKVTKCIISIIVSALAASIFCLKLKLQAAAVVLKRHYPQQIDLTLTAVNELHRVTKLSIGKSCFASIHIKLLILL